MNRLICLWLAVLSLMCAPASAASLRGIESMGLQIGVRIEPEVPLDRVDRDYIVNLISWQLDQYRVNVTPRTQNTPFLLVRVQLSRLLGSVQLLEGTKDKLEGVFSSSVLVEFHQPVVAGNDRTEEFWTATYRQEDSRTSFSRTELENTVIRSLERTLLGFIHTYRRANPLPATDSQSSGE